MHTRAHKQARAHSRTPHTHTCTDTPPALSTSDAGGRSESVRGQAPLRRRVPRRPSTVYGPYGHSPLRKLQAPLQLLVHQPLAPCPPQLPLPRGSREALSVVSVEETARPGGGWHRGSSESRPRGHGPRAHPQLNATVTCAGYAPAVPRLYAMVIYGGYAPVTRPLRQPLSAAAWGPRIPAGRPDSTWQPARRPRT